MKKLSILLSGGMLFLYACNPKVTIWRDYGEKQSNFVQAADIKTGEKLKKSHKDESFIYNQNLVEVSFGKNPDYEEWLRISKEKRKKITTLKWTKNNVNLSAAVNGEYTDTEVKRIKELYELKYFGTYYNRSVSEDDLEDILESVKRSRNDKPPGQFMSTVRNSCEITSLEDFNSFDLYVPFTNGETVKDVEVDYGRGAFEPRHVITPYESNGIFYQDLNIYNAEVYFPTLGSRAYINYTEVYSDIKYNSLFYIPESYFQEKKTISFAVPEWLDITIIEKNFEGITFNKTETAPKSIKKKLVKNVSSEDEEEAPEKTTTTTKKTPTKPKDKKPKTTPGMKYITYEFTNVAARDYKGNSSSRGQSYNYPHFLIQYNSVKEDDVVTPLTGTTRGLYKWYHELVSQLKNDTAALAGFTKKLIADKSTDEEKIKSIYYWVQDNVHYVAFEDGIAGFKPEECTDVYNNRYGDCKGMANLLVNMLHIAGYDARRVWIGTRHLNYDYSTPSVAINNHMIAAVKLDTSFIFLDGTESFCPYKQYAHRIQGREVMIEDGDSFVLKRIPEYHPEFNLESVQTRGKIDGNKLLVNTEKIYFGESRLDFIRSLNLLETQDREKALYNYVSDNNISLIPSNIKTSDIHNREGKATISYDMEVNNHIIESGDKKYISLDWDNYLSGMDFDSTRKVDFDFGQKICLKADTKIDIGKMKAEFIPSAVKAENEFYKVDLNIVQSGNQLIYHREIIAKQGYLPVSALMEWNRVHQLINNFYNDYVIVK